MHPDARLIKEGSSEQPVNGSSVQRRKSTARKLPLEWKEKRKKNQWEGYVKGQSNMQ